MAKVISEKKSVAAEVNAKVAPVRKYRTLLKEYFALRENMGRLEKSYKSLTTQGVSLEGQMKAIRELHEIDEQKLMEEVKAEMMAK